MNTSEDIMANMNNARYFTKLDLCKGYCQIPMEEADIEKTAFITQDGHYEFVRMPFGLINSGATLARGLRKALHRVENTGVYVDDIIIYNDTWPEHLSTIETVLQRLKEAKYILLNERLCHGMT